jgi:hypothetical protein
MRVVGADDVTRPPARVWRGGRMKGPKKQGCGVVQLFWWWLGDEGCLVIGDGIRNREEGSPERRTGGGGCCSRWRLLSLTIHRLNVLARDICHCPCVRRVTE